MKVEFSVAQLKALHTAVDMQFDMENDCVLEDVWMPVGQDMMSREQLNIARNATNDRVNRVVELAVLKEQLRIAICSTQPTE